MERTISKAGGTISRTDKRMWPVRLSAHT